MINSFDDAVKEMNTCFKAILNEMQKDEIKRKQEEERKRQISEQRKLDLLKGNPFNMHSEKRAKEKNLP